MSAKIAAALHAVMSKVGYIQKTGENKFHGYRYAGEADLLDKLRPAMIEAGLLLLPSATIASNDEHGNTYVSVEYTLAHKDGDIWPTPLKAIGCGNDKAKNGTIGDKGVYKALTGANKYLLFKLFQIETGDDPENELEDKYESPSPDRVEQQITYAQNFRLALVNAERASDIRMLWQQDAGMREELGIGPNSQIAKELHAEWLARGKELSAKEKVANDRAA